jgi:serine/threonine protein kinase
MDLLLGGDLRFHIARRRKFDEPSTKFFVACIIVSLEVVHSAGVIHRDIKPENLVFDNSGYLRLTDFGIAGRTNVDNSKETSGTPGYMAPEVMCRRIHSV